MFEKEAEEWVIDSVCKDCSRHEKCKGKEHCTCKECSKEKWQKGAEFGYNKAKEDVKYDLMMKLKEEGIVKPLKDSILRNERLSSQEQQELCAWIECAMDFGENLDECSEKLDYSKTIIQDMLNNSDEYVRQRAWDFIKEG